MKIGVTPDMVTIVGTLGVVVGGTLLLPDAASSHRRPRHHRLRVLRPDRRLHGSHLGVSSKWGAFLDSTLDRLGDAAIFSGLAIWLFQGGDDNLLAYVALWGW